MTSRLSLVLLQLHLVFHGIGFLQHHSKALITSRHLLVLLPLHLVFLSLGFLQHHSRALITTRPLLVLLQLHLVFLSLGKFMHATRGGTPWGETWNRALSVRDPLALAVVDHLAVVDDE